MYKIYYKSSCLHISDCAVVDCITADINEFVTKDSAKMLKFIENNKFVCLITSEPEIIFHQIADKFECVSAAGGVVEYDDNVLMIKRNELWDLPKGHVEEGERTDECALREVSEECGISALVLGEKIAETYHIYPWDSHFRLKTTHWYRMTLHEQQNFTPQTEEGISEVRWIPLSDIEHYISNTYGNIKDIILAYLKSR